MLLFSGIIKENNRYKKVLYSIKPPEKITSFVYHCGDHFLLDPLREMIKQKEVYGLITIGRKRASIGYIKGTQVKIKKEFTNYAHQNHKAGGQSALRFQRIIKEKDQRFYRKVGLKTNEIFLSMKGLSGIFIGGSGHSKSNFIAKGNLDKNLKSKIIDIVDIGYDGGIEGIQALINKIQDKIKHVRFIKEKMLINKFLEELAKNSDRVSYGNEETRNLLEKCLIKELLISEQFNGLNDILETIKSNRISYTLISTETNEGRLLSDTFGGIVGFKK